MAAIKRKHRQKSFRYRVEVYRRWFALYMKRVRQTEKEIGGILAPC